MTPRSAVAPLAGLLDSDLKFYEPCAGDGRLVDHVLSVVPGATCTGYSDIDPHGARKIADEEYGGAAHADVKEADALTLTKADLKGANAIITNPPWTRTKASGFLLHRMISHFSDMVPTWLLFDADWMHTRQATPHLARCTHIVSVGRVKWIPESNATGKDNVAWYRFVPEWAVSSNPLFIGRDMAG